MRHVAKLPDHMLAHEVRLLLDFVFRRRTEGGISTGCHVGALRAATGCMMLLLTAGVSIDEAVADRRLMGKGPVPKNMGVAVQFVFDGLPRPKTVETIMEPMPFLRHIFLHVSLRACLGSTTSTWSGRLPT